MNEINRNDGQSGRKRTLAEFLEILEPMNRPGQLTPREGSQLTLFLVEFMTDGVEPDMLKFASRFMCPDDYGDIVLERNILHLCGYPLCNNDPKGIRKDHQINYRQPTMVLPGTYLSKFCSREHYQASRFFQEQLSDQPLFARKDVTHFPYGEMDYENQTALLEEVQEISNNENKSLRQVIEEFKKLSMGEGDDFTPESQQYQQQQIDGLLNGLSAKMDEIHLVEKEGGEGDLEMNGNGRSIEGYNSIHQER